MIGNTKKRSGALFSVMLQTICAVVVTSALVLAGCDDDSGGGSGGGGSGGGGSGGAGDDALSLDDLLRKYMGANPETFDEDGEDVNVNLYFIDPSHFEDFKSELDAGGEYTCYEDDTYPRTWEQDMAFARWIEYPDDFDWHGQVGARRLDLCKEDNTVVEYRYKKASESSGRQKLDASLRKYMGSCPQIRDEGKVNKYFLDFSRFDAFKSELDAGGKYSQVDSWNDTRDWARGKEFVMLTVRADGNFDLEYCKADDSRSGFKYKKV
jgi:hypothetical protein